MQRNRRRRHVVIGRYWRQQVPIVDGLMGYEMELAELRRYCSTLHELIAEEGASAQTSEDR